MSKDNVLIKDYYNYITSNIDLLEELASKGDDSAQYVLGVLKLRETPITKETIASKQIDRAVNNLIKSAKAYNIDAMLELIYVYKKMKELEDNKGKKELYDKKIYELKNSLMNHIRFINKQLEDIDNDIEPFSTRFPKPKLKEDVKLIDELDLSIFTTKLNELCIELNNYDKEVVSEYTMQEAKNIVDYLKPESLVDVMIYCSSLNILNTFVKQKQKKISYYFKNNVKDVLLNSIVDNEIEGVKFYITDDCNMSIVYVMVGNLIFSFHQVRMTNEEKEAFINSSNYQLIVFDEVRKQKCSVSLYYNVLEYYNKISDID